jgi:hypothetical protein
VTVRKLLSELLAERFGPLETAKRERPPTASELRRRREILTGDDDRPTDPGSAT